MEREPFGEDVVCFLCDYGLVLLAGLVVVAIAFWRWQSFASQPASPAPLPTALPTNSPPPGPTSPPLTATPEPTFNPTPSATTVQPTPTRRASPTPNLPPEFVLVFIPVDWQGETQDFEPMASRQAGLFLDASGMQSYFRVKVHYLSNGPDISGISSDDLLQAVVAYGLQQIPADRYIGLTNLDLVLDDNGDIAGWTEGPGSLAVIGEASDVSITAHELGHTFGLCDEYSYFAWERQDQEFPEGCPNPYPPDCPANEQVCRGAPTEDGRNSMMGPAGMPGEYGYNTASWDHLQVVFADLADQVRE